MVAKSNEAPTHVIIIVLPLVEERDYFYETIKDRPGWVAPPRATNSFYSHYRADGRYVRVIVHTIAKMGHLEASMRVSTGLAVSPAELVILLGLAGSMNPEKIGLGDVVISNQAKIYTVNKVASISKTKADKPYYEYCEIPPADKKNGSIFVDLRDKRLSSSFARYERDFVESPGVEQPLSAIHDRLDAGRLVNVDTKSVPIRFRDLPTTLRAKEIHYGWMLGSSHVVDSKEYRDYLVEKNRDEQWDVHCQLNDRDRTRWKSGELLAVDMESFGVLKIVEKLKGLSSHEGGSGNLLGALVVRGISDLAEEKGETDRSSKNQLRKVAVSNASEVAAQIIENIDYKKMSAI